MQRVPQPALGIDTSVLESSRAPRPPGLPAPRPLSCTSPCWSTCSGALWDLFDMQERCGSVSLPLPNHLWTWAGPDHRQTPHSLPGRWSQSNPIWFPRGGPNPHTAEGQILQHASPAAPARKSMPLPLGGADPTAADGAGGGPGHTCNSHARSSMSLYRPVSLCMYSSWFQLT